MGGRPEEGHSPNMKGRVIEVRTGTQNSLTAQWRLVFESPSLVPDGDREWGDGPLDVRGRFPTTKKDLGPYLCRTRVRCRLGTTYTPYSPFVYLLFEWQHSTVPNSWQTVLSYWIGFDGLYGFIILSWHRKIFFFYSIDFLVYKKNRVIRKSWGYFIKIFQRPVTGSG